MCLMWRLQVFSLKTDESAPPELGLNIPLSVWGWCHHWDWCLWVKVDVDGAKLRWVRRSGMCHYRPLSEGGHVSFSHGPLTTSCSLCLTSFRLQGMVGLQRGAHLQLWAVGQVWCVEPACLSWNLKNVCFGFLSGRNALNHIWLAPT